MIRRTSHIDIDFVEPGRLNSPLHLSGSARDRQDEAVVDEAGLEVDVDRTRRVEAIVARPARAELGALVGVPAGSGFRRAAAEAIAGGQGSALGLLLDDVPVATLISGYMVFRLAASEPAGGGPPAVGRPGPGGQLALGVDAGVLDRMAGMCSGWRPDGAPVISIRAGRGMPMQDCPPAPALDGHWHPQPVLAPGAMRRRRAIDVGPAPDGWAVEAMFRDSFGEEGGAEGVLHEYSVTARVGPDRRLTAIDATPVVLPFDECPLAVANVARLVGLPVAELRAAVPKVLAGTDGCTHLNDLLRALGDVSWLIDRLATPA